ncbi:MAG: GPI anchored serine-threonine rich family protein, partial [Cyclobacteriaceae bacterium]|nr:GPI anchored serine-threonine rich family protein [Cyclobacteriaceae bacterium]
LLLLLLLFPMIIGQNLLVHAQRIENVKAEASGSKIIITFDLMGEEPGQKFDLEAFASHNDFAEPLMLLKGDIGKGIKAGADKRIEWNARAELRDYAGAITVEVRGMPVLATFIFIEPAMGSSARRGKSTGLVWKGGTGTERFRLELMKGEQVIKDLGNVQNTGLYTWMVPPETEKGNDYRFRMVYGDEKIESQPFAVKSKLPLALKLSPVPVLGVAGFFLYQMITRQQVEKTFLPEAPSPPTN